MPGLKNVSRLVASMIASISGSKESESHSVLVIGDSPRRCVKSSPEKEFPGQRVSIERPMVQDAQPCRATEDGHQRKAARLARIAPRRSSRVSPWTITLLNHTQARWFISLFPLGSKSKGDVGGNRTDIRSAEVGGTRVTNMNQ